MYELAFYSKLPKLFRLVQLPRPMPILGQCVTRPRFGYASVKEMFCMMLINNIIATLLGIYYPMNDQFALPVMVMELMQQSLTSLVKNHNISFFMKLSILDDVCLGLRYLHSRAPPIVHRDLTPNNILLNRHLGAKITDLGLAKVMQNTDTQSTMTPLPGTKAFMPPECFNRKPVYSTPLDVFSYGGVVLFTMTQQWPHPDTWMEIDKVTGSKRYLSELERRQCYFNQMTENSESLKSLVKSCLDDIPKNRPSMVEVSAVIKEARTACSKEKSNDIDPTVWWNTISTEQQPQQLVSSHREMLTKIHGNYIFGIKYTNILYGHKKKGP